MVCWYRYKILIKWGGELILATALWAALKKSLRMGIKDIYFRKVSYIEVSK